ncbi:TIM barrel protein [Mycetocola zhadangensis]|uniref:TIM barrel protein n=1 Tax=Mycetocola zhadangensis TaxID=1164595 RepID=UPI003A4D819D
MADGRYAINCSIALADVPVTDRAVQARRLGYEAVEFWWPFQSQAPDRDAVAEFVESVKRAEVETVLLNFPGGGPSVADRGLMCVPGRQEDFVGSARTALEIGRQLGVRRFNPMVGNAAHSWAPDTEAFETAVTNLLAIDSMLGELDAVVVLEPLSGFPDAALKTHDDAHQLVIAARAAGARNVSMLFDFYHAAVNEDPVLDSWAVDIGLIGHVQVADAPGRGWPGTGNLPLNAWLQRLHDSGYDGRVGFECGGDPLALDTAIRYLGETG